MNTPLGLRPQVSMLAALTLAVAGLLGGPAKAHAGTYQMYACDVPGINLPSPSAGAWTVYNGAAGVTLADTCSAGQGRGGAFSFSLNPPYGELPQTTGAGLELQIPSTGPQSAISIDRVVDWSATQLSPTSAGQPPAYGLNLASPIAQAPGGDASGFDGGGTTGSGHDSGTMTAGTTQHRLGVFCAYVGFGAGTCIVPSPFLRIRGIRTTLRESVAPSATIDGGSLTLPSARTGTKAISFTAADAESGVERIDVLLDGVVVASDNLARDLTRPVAQQTGDCQYTGLRACPASRTGTLNVNTASVPDGAYGLELRVTDAAGNTRTATHSAPVVIDNVPDTVVVPPVQNAVGGATKTNPSAAPDNGDGASANAKLLATFTATRRGVVTSRYGRKVLITGKLTAPDGKPIAGAKLHVLHQDKTVGAPMVAVGEIVTDEQGTFRHVTTAERSRTIRFGYRARLADTEFADTTDISLAVIARVGLTTDRRSLRNGQTVMFRGTVAGAPSDSRKVVELQVRKGKGWMTFKSTRLRNGRFRETYRFTRTVRATKYVFRARVRAESGFPFSTGQSRQVGVTVRG
jgi:hypothetical protein